MQHDKRLTPHESLQLHELLNCEVIGAKKLKATMGLVDDGELKSFMENTLNAKMRRIEGMQKFISEINTVH